MVVLSQEESRKFKRQLRPGSEQESLGVCTQDKVGECPRRRMECRNGVLTSCKTDFNCEAHLKCCPSACGKVCIDPYEEPCVLSLDTGDCHDNMTRWYFDSKKYYCRPFTYSGCHGNANNFLSKTDCKNACMFLDFCSQPGQQPGRIISLMDKRNPFIV
ncbi:hypothetical protein STEG23_035438 [Scotinomys teguina]